MQPKEEKESLLLPLRNQPTERPIPEDIYPVIDTDIARDNVENDLTAADRQDL